MDLWNKLFFLFAFLFVSYSPASAQALQAEQVYLQTDKGIYETGEDLWFKSYVLDRSSLALSPESQTLFVEMLDGQDSIVWQEKYPVQAGIADGHIYIDKELNPGDYRIHAYTKFSFLNDTIQPFYPKKIRVVKNIANHGHNSSVQSNTTVAKLAFFRKEAT